MAGFLRVLDVGQCGFDHTAIADFVHQSTGAVVDRAATAADMDACLARHRYALILINRILDADGTPGLDVIKNMKNKPGCPPLMLVSNFPDAQRAAVDAGAVEGFGKNSLHLARTAELLRAAVERKTEPGG